ncbi:hypothetical protein ACF0H5_019321 [Mactra antiquata]
MKFGIICCMESMEGGETSPDSNTMGTVKELKDFLLEAELEHYYNAFKNELKIASVPQIKYVAEEDLTSIGMTKPEMRRLKKFYKKECPQGKLEKFKRALMDRTSLSPTSRTMSPPPSDHRISRPISYIRPTGRQIISADSIEVNKTLGEGEFGIVQQGVWTAEDGEKVQVALKCLSRDRLENGTQEFLKEAGLMQTIDHENIVRMYGVVLDKENSLMLVTELAPMRSLLECLKDPMMRQDFPLPRLCDFAQQISDGMSYLESKRLIHRDLAARNILVFNKGRVKISDFGLSRALGRGKDYYQSNFSINLKLPIAWCAPECINYLKFTSSSDVWAFGVTLWELFTYGFQPWSGMSGQQILDAIDSPNYQRLERPDLCPKNYYDLMLKCWDHEPENRPTFSEMYMMLPQMRPTQVKAVKDFPEITVPKDYIYYRAYDVIVVLDKTPSNPPAPGLWKGSLMSGKTGFFDPCNTVPFIEPKSSPEAHTPKKSIMRKDSKRGTGKKIRPDMISRPQNDLRHTGHIGYDGAVFGDVGFIGDNYDKLPIKTASIGKLDDSRNSINLSRMSDSPEKDVQLSLSDTSLNAGNHKTNGFGRSWISVESLESQTTGRTDEREDGYLDIDDDNILADFKMPDLGSSFDFGGSFMDEVLKALHEKESQLDNNDESTEHNKDDTKDDVNGFKSFSDDFGFSSSDRFSGIAPPPREPSLSPPKEVQSPPPLPSQPPRIEPKPSKIEQQRLQAKVKPMSTSDEKMMDDAFNLANEFASQSGRAQMVRQESLSDKASDQESGSESPRLISKLKASIKRSPKRERKRTFSDSLNHEVEDDVPPEAQEAYNMLVVHGSVKEGSRGNNQTSCTASEQIKRESLISNGSAGHNFAYADSSSSSISRTPDRDSPLKSVSRHSSERSSMSPPNLARLNSTSAPERPTPRPRPDVPPPTLPKRGEIPVPKPRPEVQRVEPTPRPPPPPIPVKDFDTSSALSSDSASTGAFDNPLLIREEDWKNSEESLRSERNSQHLHEEKVDSLNTSTDSGRKSTSPSDVSQSSASKFSFFEEEFDQPSPREIMSKLARESRLRRSLDHQRGVGEGDIVPNKNLREPQGIPGKTYSTGNNDEEEVDTNPLRMLRGGVIPVRGGRGGSGMSSNKPTLRHPKLHFTTGSSLQHSVSMDTGRDRHVSQSDTHTLPEVENESLDSGHSSPPPALPPRSLSICDSNLISNPLPLPPRNPRRTVSLSIKPRERKYPLLLEHNTNSISLCNSPVVGWHTSQVSQSVAERLSTSNVESSDYDCDTKVSDFTFNEIILANEKYTKPFPIPDHLNEACNPLNATDSSSLAELPLAPPPPPPPPPYQIAVSMEMDNDSDDNVFESPMNSGNFSCSKNVNLSSEGGTSGASTFPRGFKLFGIKTVKCSLEQLGFYNHKDPFWEPNVIIGDQRSLSEQSATSEMDTSPLMLAKYKCSEGVSYEDLLDFALDREKNGEEVILIQKLFGSDVTREDCLQALQDTKWDRNKAIKYIKLKQLLSIELGDVSRCKEALLACDWNIQNAADYLLKLEGQRPGRRTPPSPECVDV